MRRMAQAAALALAVGAAGAAWAQQSSKDVYKGRVKEGLYEVRTDVDLSGVPAVAKEKQKSTHTRQRCFAREHLERGIEAGKDCEVKSYKATDTSASIVMACKDGSVSEMKLSFKPSGFTTETRTTGKEDGKPFVAAFREEAKYAGPCPQPPTPAPAPKK